MCHNKQITRSKNGLVSYCKSCHHFQIAFGTLAFTMREDEFSGLIHYLETWLPNYDRCMMTKNIWIPLRENQVCMLLNGNELEEFKEMTTEAYQGFLLSELLQDLPIQGSDQSQPA
jgi:hypothetical protein